MEGLRSLLHVILLSLMVIFICLPSFHAINTINFTKRCCNMGHFSSTCQDYRNQTSQHELNKYCHTIFYDCCISKKSEESCRKGKLIAEGGGSDSRCHNSKDPIFSSCCFECRRGLTSGSCHRPIIANISDQAFVECCSRERRLPNIKCPPGKRVMPNGTCVNINECEEGTHFCREDETCVDIEDGHYCESVECLPSQKLVRGECVSKEECDQGFQYDTARDSCVNINECLNSSSCPSNTICKDTEGSFECLEDFCEDGFRLVIDPSSRMEYCQDVDECREGTHSCQETEVCVNTHNGYSCECAPGFARKAGSGGLCQDIDECESSSMTSRLCDEVTSYCINTPGSYRCVCRTGYTEVVFDRNGRRACVDEQDASNFINNARFVRLASSSSTRAMSLIWMSSWTIVFSILITLGQVPSLLFTHHLHLDCS